MPALVQENDEALAAAARGGSLAAWETFVRRHGPRLLAYCDRMIGDEALARDVWVRTLSGLWGRLDSQPRERKLATAAFALATSLCSRAQGASTAARPMPSDASSLEARSQRLRRCLQGLPFAGRAALCLCYFDNFPYPEAERCLGFPPLGARRLCADAYAALARALGPGFLNEGLK